MVKNIVIEISVKTCDFKIFDQLARSPKIKENVSYENLFNQFSSLGAKEKFHVD